MKKNQIELLTEKMKEKRMTYATIGKVIKKTRKTVYNKINGNGQWKIKEIDKIVEILQLTIAEANEIFFE